MFVLNFDLPSYIFLYELHLPDVDFTMFGLEDLNNTSTTGLVGLDFTVPSFEDDSSTVFILGTLSAALLSLMVSSDLNVCSCKLCHVSSVECTNLPKPVENLLNISHGVDVPVSNISAIIRKEQYILVTFSCYQSCCCKLTESYTF